MDVAVRQHFVIETGVLEDVERSGGTIRIAVVPGCEQVPAIGGHRQVRVMGAFEHQPEERQHARPRPEARGESATAGGGTFEPLQQAVQPVALVVEGVVARQQLARLGEQDHHQPHRHPAGGAVDILRAHARGRIVVAERGFGRQGIGGVLQGPVVPGDIRLVRRDSREVLLVRAVLGDVRLVRSFDQAGQRVAVTADEDLHRFAHPLAEYLGELRLSLAGVANRL